METKYENKLERLKDVMILISSQLHSNQSFTDKLFKLLCCTDFDTTGSNGHSKYEENVAKINTLYREATEMNKAAAEATNRDTFIAFAPSSYSAIIGNFLSTDFLVYAKTVSKLKFANKEELLDVIYLSKIISSKIAKNNVDFLYNNMYRFEANELIFIIFSLSFTEIATIPKEKFNEILEIAFKIDSKLYRDIKSLDVINNKPKVEGKSITDFINSLDVINNKPKVEGKSITDDFINEKSKRTVTQQPFTSPTEKCTGKCTRKCDCNKTPSIISIKRIPSNRVRTSNRPQESFIDSLRKNTTNQKENNSSDIFDCAFAAFEEFFNSLNED